MSTNRIPGLALLAVIAAVVGGCGGGNDNNNASTTSTTQTTPTQTQTQTTPSSTQTGAKKSVTVGMDEYSFSPSNVTIARGGTITVQNNGKIAHNLTIKNGPKTSTFLPGKSEKLKVDLAPGKYDFFCSVPGHEQLGMKGTLTVK
jgi:plastocyanin